MLASVVLVALSSAKDKAVIGSALQFATTNYHALGAGALAIYNFDEASGNALDISGNNNTAVLNCIAADGTCRSKDTPNASTNSFGLLTHPSGGGSYMTATLNGRVNQLTQFTLSAWIKPTTIANYEAIANVTDGFSRLAYFDVRSGGLLVQRGNCDSSSDLTPVQAGKWQQITLTYNGSTLALYINGKFIKNPAMSGSCNSGTPTLIYIGTTSAGNDTFGGLIDDVAVYTQALSDAQIGHMYAMTAGDHGLAIK